MEKKYVFTEEVIEINGRILHRIKAVKPFGNVKNGDLGGFIEKEENLSHEGDCWVYGNAKVYCNVRVFGNAKVYCNVRVFDNVRIFGNVRVFDNVRIFGNAKVFGNAEVFDNAEICDNAKVFDNAEIFGNAKVFDNAEICDNAKVFDNAIVFGYAKVHGNAEVYKTEDYIVFKNWWSSGRYFTWTRSNNMWRVGCFYGNGDELIKKAYADSEKSGKEYERIVKYVEEILNEK